MKGKKSLIFVFLMVSILGLVTYYYNKPHVDVKKTKAAYVVSAQNLISQYQENETEANEKYAENIIQVNGEIFNISTLKGNSVITLRDGNSESSIICHMLPEENRRALELKKGQNIEIKGISTGYLLDVIMVKCTLVK